MLTKKRAQQNGSQPIVSPQKMEVCVPRFIGLMVGSIAGCGLLFSIVAGSTAWLSASIAEGDQRAELVQESAERGNQTAAFGSVLLALHIAGGMKGECDED